MHTDQPEEPATTRASLLPEEKAAGSADPEAQADAILAESEERSAERDDDPDADVEHRTSEEATEAPV